MKSQLKQIACFAIEKGTTSLSFERNSITFYSRCFFNYIYPEHEKVPARMFLKIGAFPNAYKKKVDEARVMAILEPLLIFKFETFENAEFIYL